MSGGCPKGGDKFAFLLSLKHDIPITEYKPDWSIGKFAGFARNSLIAEDSDIIIAVVSDKENPHAGGTGDTIKKAERLGKTIHLV